MFRTSTQILLSSSASASSSTHHPTPSVFRYYNGLSGNTVTVDLNIVKDNINAIKKFQTEEEETAGNNSKKKQAQPPLFMAVVKDNAYSTDMLQMAKALNDNNLADAFMTAHFPEARILREQVLSSQKDIADKMILAVYAEPSDYQDVCGLQIDTTVDDSKRLALLGEAAKKVGKPARVHLHINTGMNRLGALPEEAVPLTKQILGGCEDGRFIFAGLKTHLSTADETHNDFCFQQEDAFHNVVRDVLAICPQKHRPQVIHSQNTAWALRYQPWKDKNYETYNMQNWPRRMIRVGIGMYGYCALEVENTKKLLKSAVTIRSQIASLHYPPPGSPISYARKQYAPSAEEQAKSGKRFRIATIPQGYGEGYTKWDGNFVCIRGKKCPLVGKITMDFIMADVTELGEDVERGDSVLLFGKEDMLSNEECQGNNGMEVEVHQAGAAAGTSPHQFLARGGYRLNRVFIPIEN